MTWKILWSDARRAAAESHFKRAAQLFADSLAEAQRTRKTDDPNFQDFLQERAEFLQLLQNQTQAFQSNEGPSEPSAPHETESNPIGQSDASRFEPGELMSGKYQVMRTLGTGGMAVVYLVRDEFDKLFAMKILNQGITDERQATERFEREARLIKSMRHPNIISVFDFGKMPDGRSYFLMEFVEGESLLSVLESQFKLSMTRTCRITLQICDAMAHAHELGIVHRDLKPSNVILVSDKATSDRVKLVDFGIAKLNRPWEGMESRLTQDGQVLGSPAYMSPEQCLGNPLDHRSDIYSLGCVMYQLLCGVPPFWGEHAMAILYKQVNESPTALQVSSKTITPKLEEIVLRSLCKDPNDRYQSMTDLESELVKLMLQEA